MVISIKVIVYGVDVMCYGVIYHKDPNNAAQQ